MNRILFFLLIPTLSFSQGKDVLTYFKSKDSLVGVKDHTGKIIVPAQFKVFSFLKDGDPVKEETIYFDGSKKDEIKEKNAWGYVYDKKGNFLYRPFLYDNGADYFSEGVRRFVKNGKVGFVDRNGTTVIEAKHDFVSPFNYGYAAYCDGCDWEKTNDEHKAMVGGTWGVMNFKGEVIQPVAEQTNSVEVNGKFYPNPFKYNEKEKRILQFFEKQNTKLSEIYYVNWYNKLSKEEKKLFFEIVERPKENFPFYQVNTYDYRKIDVGLTFDFKFLVSAEGQEIFALDYDNEKVPFEKWLKREIGKAQKYQEEHPDNPNKISK
ncbi:WG repeat-containing protein [Chryseobacterium sp. Chry.R1]|uniref:WG repeat-containing protein n=1 Tax=Chryseobacterium sp. Chry.R1 TaxID=3139392 RepID=UPI0031F73879